jgi:hypothetical protein
MCDTFGHNYKPPSPWIQLLDHLPDEFEFGESTDEFMGQCDDMGIYENDL